MPFTLLPASAAAFAPRSSPNVVLNTKVDPWLTATLKRVNRVKRPLNSVPQHYRCLREILSGPNAIWTLCSIMLTKAPDTELRRDENPLVEALFNHQIVHIEAYVVHVDMVSQNEVAFKLTSETIEALVDYHADVWTPDAAAATWAWSDKAAQLTRLRDDFVQAANRFVYRAPCSALDGLEEDGAGELLAGASDDVKQQILSLFVPLLPPPPPRVVDVVRSAPVLPSSTASDRWWPTSVSPAPSDSWKIVPSSPSATSSVDSNSGLWASMSLGDLQASSPPPSYSQPAATYATSSTIYTPSTMAFADVSSAYTEATSAFAEATTALIDVSSSFDLPAYTTASYNAPEYYSAPTNSPPLAPSSTSILLPSVLAGQCSIAASFGGYGYPGYSGFGWDTKYPEFGMSGMQYAPII